MKNIKLRYYLRGLGIGMVVTAFILIAVGNKENTLTDEQIIERAESLGMVDGSNLVLSDLKNDKDDKDEKVEPDIKDAESIETEPYIENAENVDTEPATGDAENLQAESDIGETEAQETPSVETDIEETEEPEPSSTDTDVEGTEEPETPSAEPNTEENITEQEVDTKKDKQEAIVEENTVTLTIYAGANSYTVSKKLAEVGLVADAKVFDDYLCDNGYSKTVRVGVYKIAKGTSEEEIARIIAQKR